MLKMVRIRDPTLCKFHTSDTLSTLGKNLYWYNVTITGHTDHGLHVIFLNTAISSSSYCLIVATTPFLSYRLSYKLALALFGAEVLRVACEPKKQLVLIAGSQRLLIDQRLSKPGGGGARGVSSYFTKESY